MTNPNLTYLSDEWVRMSKMLRCRERTSVISQSDGAATSFIADDESFHLRHDGDQWVVDRTDDRNRRHNNTATFSTHELAEKYLLWRWGSTVRDAYGAESLGPRLYKAGYAREVSVSGADNNRDVVLRSACGTAILPEPYAAIFSHLMLKSRDQIHEMLTFDLTF